MLIASVSRRTRGLEKVIRQFIWSSYANTGGTYVDALKEVYAIADFQGIKGLEPWNRLDEVFILRGINEFC
ncbi:MAG: hypothetical protein Q8J66_04580 [Methylotenera sp.]|nr:hypothetical protein [Methylotenera sp.]